MGSKIFCYGRSTIASGNDILKMPTPRSDKAFGESLNTQDAAKRIDAGLFALGEEEKALARGSRRGDNKTFKAIAEELGRQIRDAPLLSASLSHRPDGGQPISKVVMLVARLPENRGQQPVQVLKYLKGLSDACDVLLVTTNEPTDVASYYTDDRETTRIQEEVYARAALQKDLSPEQHSRVRFFSARCWTADGLGEMISEIGAFSPDVALCFLGIIQTRIVRSLIAKHMGLIEVQFNIKNDVSESCHVVLAHGRCLNFDDKIGPARWSNHHIPIEFPTDDGPLTDYPAHIKRAPETKLRLVSVLSIDRIAHALREVYQSEDFEIIDSLFEAYPSLDWVFVGIDDADAFLAIHDVLSNRAREKRIKWARWVGNLRALYRESDVFVHLPGLMGGAMGIAIAIDEGVPVICGRQSDGANILREDHTFEYMVDFFLCLEQLVSDETFRKITAAEQKRHLGRHHSVEDVGRQMMSYAALARERFLQS